MTYEPNFLLRGVAGSTAHGLARAGSDEDLHGVFGWPTEALYGLEKPKETLDGHEPQDYSYHEVEKYIRLALSNNPTVLETMWLDEYKDVAPVWGETLLLNRQQFLFTKGVRNAYLGYAESQFKKIQARANGTFSSDTKNRASKHARHMFRLLEQAEYLLTTGDMKITVDSPEWYFALEEMPWSEWVRIYLGVAARIREVESVLPEQPNREWANGFLIAYRKAH